MECRIECVVDKTNHKCCLECEKYEECTIRCDYLDIYKFTEKRPDYVKENKDENCKR